jgi:hypothetical protein
VTVSTSNAVEAARFSVQWPLSVEGGFTPELYFTVDASLR